MTLDRTFIVLNRASRERTRPLAERMSDEQTPTKVGEFWTAGIVFAYFASCDDHVLQALEKTGQIGKPFWKVSSPDSSAIYRYALRAFDCRHSNCDNG